MKITPDSAFLPERVVQDVETMTGARPRRPSWYSASHQPPHWLGCTGRRAGVGAGSGVIHTLDQTWPRVEQPRRWRVTIGQSGVVAV